MYGLGANSGQGRGMKDEEEVVAMLVVPSEYIYHLNQVAGLTRDNLIVLERKFASRAGFEVVKHPIDRCTSVAYFDERPMMSIIGGVLVTSVIALACVGLISSWNELEAGTRVPLGSLAIAGMYGVRKIFGARRHRFVFTMQDQTRFSWASKSGEHALWKPSVDQIVEFVRSRRLLSTP